jgi:hypothetical protein
LAGVRLDFGRCLFGLLGFRQVFGLNLAGVRFDCLDSGRCSV